MFGPRRRWKRPRRVPRRGFQMAGFDLFISHCRGSFRSPLGPWAKGTLGRGVGLCSLGGNLSSVLVQHAWKAARMVIDRFETLCWCGCPLTFTRFFRGATSSRTPEARGSSYTAPNTAPNAEAYAADEGMDLRNGQPVPANGARVSRWPDEPARPRIANRATSRIADAAASAAPSPRSAARSRRCGHDQMAARIVCGPGAAPIGR
jgi:hypothetical protein